MSKQSKTHSAWAGPTTYLQRFGDAMQLLCAGHRPGDALLVEWLDPASETYTLQEFAIEHGPAWSQGIVVIDAALVMAEFPTEGDDHEEASTDPSNADVEDESPARSLGTCNLFPPCDRLAEIWVDGGSKADQT